MNILDKVICIDRFGTEFEDRDKNEVYVVMKISETYGEEYVTVSDKHGEIYEGYLPNRFQIVGHVDKSKNKALILDLMELVKEVRAESINTPWDYDEILDDLQGMLEEMDLVPVS